MVKYHIYEGLIEGDLEDVITDTGEDQDYAYESFKQRIRGERLIEDDLEDVITDTGEDQDYAYESFKQRVKKIRPKGERLIDPIDNIFNRILFVSFTPEFEPPYGGRNA